MTAPQHWIQYYTRKRIVHQWTQVDLLNTVKCQKILEIGPSYGLVTAMLVNAGYDVTTLDIGERLFAKPETNHRLADIRQIEAGDIAGFDAILCCETLEHIEWQSVDRVLASLRASNARYLVLSVPYMAFQLTLDLYLNARIFRQYFSIKKLRNFRIFKKEPEGGHQWEVGYQGHSLHEWEDKIKKNGWSIRKRDFTEHCRSVFHLLEAM